MSIPSHMPAEKYHAMDDEVILVSKSELKRDAAELKKLGEQLVQLSKNQREKLPLDDDLRVAIELAGQLKREGRRRQLQLVGKMLRQRDVQPLRKAMDKLQNRHNQQLVLFHKLEIWRDALLEQGDEAITRLLEQWPEADRQHLRMLVRKARKEQADNKPPASSRLIFQYLRQMAENQT